jgi:hypothetical protein
MGNSFIHVSGIVENDMVIASKEDIGFQCTTVSGEVVFKDHSEGWFKLYVTLNEEFSGQSNYSLYVSPDTYDRYQIGDNYTETMCDIVVYQELKQTIQDLLDAGILEEI